MWRVPRDRIVSDVAMILRTEKSVMFVIRGEATGSSETTGRSTSTWCAPRGHQGRHRLAILGTINAVLATPLTHADIDGVYASARPPLAGESDDTSPSCPGNTPAAGLVHRRWQVHHLPSNGGRRCCALIPARVAPSITEKVVPGRRRLLLALVNQAEHIGALQGLRPYCAICGPPAVRRATRWRPPIPAC